MNCPDCGENDVHEDDAIGEYSCNACGYVWSMVIDDVGMEFQDMGNGKKTRIGVEVKFNNTKFNTIKKAQQKMDDLVLKIGLTQNISDNALKIYKKALEGGLTKGLRSDLTVGACVYLAAKLQNKPVIMLDISTRIDTSVFRLGKVYKQLKHKLNYTVQDTDPCLFVERFANKLELGDKVGPVIETAMRVIARLKKDWIVTGRLPNGITAAALLISCRIHRFDRNYDDVARYAGVCGYTMKQRLKEFFTTSTAQLTINEFMSFNLEDESNPPAFKQNVSDEEITEYDTSLTSNDMDIINGICKEVDDARQCETSIVEQMKFIEESASGRFDSELTPEFLMRLVADENDEDFMEIDNEELMERVSLMKNCISQNLTKNEYYEDIESKIEPGKGENCESEDGDYENNDNGDGDKADENCLKLPIKIPISIECEEINFRKKFPDLLTDEDFANCRYNPDEEWINREIYSLEQSQTKLKWFWSQKENREFFRKEKRKKEERLKRKATETDEMKAKRDKRRKTRDDRRKKIVQDLDKMMEQNSATGSEVVKSPLVSPDKRLLDTQHSTVTSSQMKIDEDEFLDNYSNSKNYEDNYLSGSECYE